MRRKPTFIHEKPGWPRFVWDAKAIESLLAAVRYKQGRLLGRMESLGFDARTEANLAVLTSDVVKTSAIEGETLDAHEVRSSIARRLGLDTVGSKKPGRVVEGVVAMTIDATRQFELPLSKKRLFAWHSSLFPDRRNAFGRITTGAWRTAKSGPMRVVSGPIGGETVHFEAPKSDRLDAEMMRFIAWFNAPASEDAVLRAAIAHLWFVTIHPFEDGNGRIARAIADMALVRSDGLPERYYSVSTQIESERGEYYRQLESAQRGDSDITNWITWFLECLERAVIGAERTLEAVLSKARYWQFANRFPLNDRQRLVISRLLDGFVGNLSTSKYAKLAKGSTDTALRDIAELVERGLLTRNSGGGRSTSYRLADLKHGERA